MDSPDNTWIALHVFYASDSNPIVVEAVVPLVAQLREEGLIDGWFFIKYWMEGPHLRVRLHPRRPHQREEVLRRGQDALASFLRRRPALYETDVEGLSELYKKMYVAEYGLASWETTYGADGVMPFQPNNSVAMRPYEPEVDRYGGPRGIELAEWHFEHSSDMVARLLATTNTNVRPLLLGLAGQLSLMLAYTFLGTDERVGRFFQRYRSFWETSYQEPSDDYHSSFDKSLDRTRGTLLARMDRIRSAVGTPADDLAGIERQWLVHCRELHTKVRRAAAAGELEFASRRGPDPARIDDEEALAAVLLSSYVHMTNNRLGVAILDEIYLSYLIEQCLATSAPEPMPA